MEKCKAGLAMLSADWFNQIGLTSTENEDSNICKMAAQNARQVVETLSDVFELVHTEVISTAEQARDACRAYRQAEVDVIILTSILYSGDEPIVEILQTMSGTPILLWSFHPDTRLEQVSTIARYFRVTGAAGMLQGCAPIFRFGVRPGFVFGAPGSSQLAQELEDHAAVYRTIAALRRLKIGIIGRRYFSMTGAWTDEFRLKKQLGPELVWISAMECAAEAEKLDEAQVRSFVDSQTKQYETVDLTPEAIHAAARASMAVDALSLKYGCQAMAVQDMDEELHALLGVRPQMSFPPLFDRGVVVGMEGDVTSTLCVWMLQSLTGVPAMYGEVFTYSEADDFLVMGHASMHNLSFAGEHEITLVQDGEFNQQDRFSGVWNEFICKPGEVTLVCLFEEDNGYHFLTCRGESLDSPKWIPGNVHALIRPKVPVRTFLERAVERGTTQHFAICYGDAVRRVRLLAKELRIPCFDLEVQ